MRAVLAVAAALLVAACAPASSPSESFSSPPPSSTTSSPSSSPSPSAVCEAAPPSPVRETGWQVCLPLGAAVEFDKVGSDEFDVFAEVGGERMQVGRLRVWKPRLGERPKSPSWLLLHEDTAGKRALYGRNEVLAPGSLSGSELEQLYDLAIDFLLNPKSYSLVAG